MTYVQLVFLIGAACVSPLDTHVASTEAYKVPCAEFRPVPIVANPFKEAQGRVSAPVATRAGEAGAKPAQPPRYEYGKAKKKPGRKVGRCGAKKTVWYWKGGRKKWRCR